MGLSSRRPHHILQLVRGIGPEKLFVVVDEDGRDKLGRKIVWHRKRTY